MQDGLGLLDLHVGEAGGFQQAAQRLRGRARERTRVFLAAGAGL